MARSARCSEKRGSCSTEREDMLVSLCVRLTARSRADYPGGGGILTHALGLDLIRRENPQASQLAHDGKLLITTSGLLQPGVAPLGYVRVDPGDICAVRITAAGEPAAGALLRSLHSGPAVVQIGRADFEVVSIGLERVEGGNPASFGALLETAKSKDPTLPMKVEFVSPTTFRRGRTWLAIPAPEQMFGSGAPDADRGLIAKWCTVGGPAIFNGFSGTRIGVSGCELRTGESRVRADNPFAPTFTGQCEFMAATPSGTRAMWALGLFAQFAGVGWKTTMGMGQVSLRGTE